MSPRVLLPVTLCLALTTLALGPPRLARGDGVDAASPTDPKEMARRLGEQALDAHAHGRFAEAFERFETAEKIAHSPVLVLWMARSKRALGELVAARALYDRVATEELPADASAKWQSARDDARAELALLDKKIPHLRVELSGAPPRTSLEIDGRAAVAAEDVALDPGDHTVTATPPGAARIRRSVHLAEGDRPRTLTLRFGRSGSLVPGGVTLGVGLASLAAGAVTGGVALSLAASVKDHCVGQRCLASDRGKADGADALARASTGLFIAGGVVSAVGVTLLVVRPGSSSDAPNASFEIGPARATLSARF